MPKPTLDDIKQREKAAEAAAEAAKSGGRVLPRNTPIPGARSPEGKAALLDQMQEFQKDLRKVNTQGEERVELDELPEAAKAELEQGKFRYTNTKFDNKEVRAAIEKRCEPMDFGDLIIRGKVTQRVVILPGKLSVVFESMRAKDFWWLEVEAKKFEPAFLAASWVSFAQLSISIVAINDESMPRIVDEAGNISMPMFKERHDRIMALPDAIVSILMVNHGWFRDRVQSLMDDDFEQLKNG